MQQNQIVNMMYVSKNGDITKRQVSIVRLIGDSFQAYCFSRPAKRTFLINNVLAVIPIIKNERSIV